MFQKFTDKIKKNSEGYHRNVKVAVLCFLIVLMISSVFVYKVQHDRQIRIQRQLAEKVLRFHVLANSDSANDQALKLEVRDAIGGYMQENLEATVDKEASKAVIETHLAEIEAVAEEIVVRKGYSYDVTARLTECDFPVKNYGEYTFPAGTYEALQVVIGEGEGANWWCVLYPNMCFENSIYEIVDANAKKALREVLDKEEYEAVLASGKYEIRFRFLEWFR